MNSKRFWILIINAVLILPVYKLVRACSDGPDPYDYFPSFFQNSISPTVAYTPFYYTRYLTYYDEWYDYNETESLPDANIAEWKTFTGNTVPEADLNSFIYSFPYEALSNLYYHIEKGNPLNVSAEVQSNAFTKWFIDHKDLEALGYLMYAKQCEPNAQSTNSWEAPPRDSAKMVRLAKNGLQLHKAAKQDFFKWRYAFQAMRMAYYNGNNAQTLDIYNTLIGDRTDGGTMYPRCLGLKAGALFRTKQNVEAAYLYSLVFDKSDAMKKSAFLSYDWSDGFKNSALVLAKCKSAHERAVVHVMNGLHEYEEEALPFLEKAYSIEPTIGGLDVLMTREIQKGEENYLQPRLLVRRNIWTREFGGYNRYEMDIPYTGGPEEVSRIKQLEVTYTSYLAKLDAFAAKVATEGKAGHKAFWLLSSAYIHFMQDDPAGTKKYLDLASAQTMSPREHDLHDIINTLYIVKRAKNITPEVEAELLPSLKWLDDRATKSTVFNKTYRDLMSTVLVSAYLRDRDTVKAIYTFARSMRTEQGGFSVDEDFMDLPGTLLEHISISGLQACEAFAASRGKTSYDKWLLAKTPYSASVLKELEGTKYLRKHQFGEALSVLKDVDQFDLDRRILPDPFLFYIPEVHEQYASDSVHSYTKLSFAKRMEELEVTLLKHKDDPAALFDYAMGLYSMTYYGKASTAFTYYRSTSDGYGYYQSPDRDKLPDYLRDYYSANTAEQYFIKAAATTTNPDLRAKSLWMAARCWQKRCPEEKSHSAYGSSDSVYYRYSLTNPYYPRLKETSTQSPLFEQARASCGYLRDYLKRSK